ncbi:MAG TPA: arabinan endo-1,5-alpha-L-arabinosidase [Candidatus Nocardiopsis merdipullorum]|nr:arabinan endo-1,5-alpha-L-arabinosidase [Candidatus Nocardiopsis merdipullorum]
MHPLIRTASALGAACLLLSMAVPSAAAQDWDRPPNNPGLPVTGHQPDDLHPLAGGLRVHDPALYAGDDTEDWYVFGTGSAEINDGTIQVRHSPDGEHWTYVGTVWDTIPDWVHESVPGVETLWAPEIFESDGTFYLYYAASTFGDNRSVIGLATNTVLDPDHPDHEWVDHGPVIESHSGDDHNAIDPGVVEDADGHHWMTFGSFWSGIHMVELDWPAGTVADGAKTIHLADRQEPPNAVEAPHIVHRDGHYYLFMSWDTCCEVGADYKVVVGRATDVTGPYLDADGVPLLEGGGTLLIGEEGTITGSGGQSVSGDVLAYHYYDTDLGPDFDFRLALRPLQWSADGWPHVD